MRISRSLALLLFLGALSHACRTAVPRTAEPTPPLRQTLLVVAPGEWKSALDPYFELKRSQGLAPEFLEVESIQIGDPKDWASQLRKRIAARKPEYVFLVGDGTKVPTFYHHSDINWSEFTKSMWLYSDAFYGVPEGVDPMDPKLRGISLAIGRLQAPTVADVDRYVRKAIRYELDSRATGSAFLLSDRNYDRDDLLFREYAPILAILSKEYWTLNHKLGNPKTFKEAVPSDLASALDADCPFVFYVGHGAAQWWGANSFALDKVRLANRRPIPLVVAVACETALGAPNVPWYPYYTSDGKLQNFSKWDSKKDGPITRKLIGDVHALQACTITENYSRRFTSHDDFGAMAYIGETVVTHADYGFVTELLRQVNAAYCFRDGAVRIGDVYRNLFGNKGVSARPYHFQLVGDPSTPLLPPRSAR